MQNVQLVRALEGELAKTIRSLESVKNARVHLVMSRRQLFTRDKPNASAAVVLVVGAGVEVGVGDWVGVTHPVGGSFPASDTQKHQS